MLMGGTDVNPARYGEQPHPETEDPDDERDRREAALIADAWSLIAISRYAGECRILNVQHGGSG